MQGISIFILDELINYLSENSNMLIHLATMKAYNKNDDISLFNK